MDAAAAARATRAVPTIPRDDDGPVFREPWEAQAFAMALSLHARGLFTWNEWADTLGGEIKRAQASGDPDTGETYYRHWLATLERLVADPPDYIVVAHADARAEDQGSALLSHPALARLYPPARRIVLPNKLTACGGPSLPAALDWLTAQARHIQPAP